MRSCVSLDHQAFRSRQKTVEIEGVVNFPVRVAYTDVGEGEPIVLLHGIPTWSYLYNDVIPKLAEHYRVIGFLKMRRMNLRSRFIGFCRNAREFVLFLFLKSNRTVLIFVGFENIFVNIKLINRG